MKVWLLFQKLGILALMLTILIIIARSEEKKKQKKSDDYLTSINIHFTGKILSVIRPPASNGCGIIDIKLITSNVNFYDPRKELDVYYCLIKDSIAQIYQFGAGFCSPGDMIEVNTAERRISVSSQTRGDASWTLKLYSHRSFYRLAERKYQDFFNRK